MGQNTFENSTKKKNLGCFIFLTAAQHIKQFINLSFFYLNGTMFYLNGTMLKKTLFFFSSAVVALNNSQQNEWDSNSHSTITYFIYNLMHSSFQIFYILFSLLFYFYLMFLYPISQVFLFYFRYLDLLHGENTHLKRKAVSHQQNW